MKVKSVISSYLGFKKSKKKGAEAALASSVADSSLNDSAISSIAITEGGGDAVDESFDNGSAFDILGDIGDDTEHEDTVIGKIEASQPSTQSKDANEPTSDSQIPPENDPLLVRKLAKSYDRIGTLEGANDVLRLQLKLAMRYGDQMRDMYERLSASQMSQSMISQQVGSLSTDTSFTVQNNQQRGLPSGIPNPRSIHPQSSSTGTAGIAMSNKILDDSGFMLNMPSPIYPSSPMTPGVFLGGGLTPSVNVITPMVHAGLGSNDPEDADDSIDRHAVSAMDASLISLEGEKPEDPNNADMSTEFHDPLEGEENTTKTPYRSITASSSSSEQRKSVKFASGPSNNKTPMTVDSLATPSTLGSATVASTLTTGTTASAVGTGDLYTSPMSPFVLRTPDKTNIEAGENSGVFYTPTSDPILLSQLKNQIEELSTALYNLKWGFQKR